MKKDFLLQKFLNYQTVETNGRLYIKKTEVMESVKGLTFWKIRINIFVYYFF